MEFNYCYFHFLKIMIIKTTIIIKNISACQKEIGINLIFVFDRIFKIFFDVRSFRRANFYYFIYISKMFNFLLTHYSWSLYIFSHIFHSHSIQRKEYHIPHDPFYFQNFVSFLLLLLKHQHF